MNRLCKLAPIAIGFGLCCGIVHADPSWVGNADYQLAPGGNATNADDVGPFNTYDFATNSPVLIQGIGGADPQSLVVGDQLQGYYQTYVSDHLLNHTAASSPKLDVFGAAGPGNGYELTLTSSFTETVTAVIGTTATFNITGGSANLYFDPHPDYNFAADSGFTDGTSILSASIVGGSGTVLNGQIGVASLTLAVNSFNLNVYIPATLTSGQSIFSLELINPNTSPLAVSSVEGHLVNPATDVLASADGYLVLSVPEPQTWMMMPAGLGVIAFATTRRKSKINLIMA